MADIRKDLLNSIFTDRIHALESYLDILNWSIRRENHIALLCLGNAECFKGAPLANAETFLALRFDANPTRFCIGRFSSTTLHDAMFRHYATIAQDSRIAADIVRKDTPLDFTEPLIVFISSHEPFRQSPVTFHPQKPEYICLSLNAFIEMWGTIKRYAETYRNMTLNTAPTPQRS